MGRRKRTKKKNIFLMKKVCALAQSGRVLRRLLFLIFSSGPKPVKSGCGVSGPVFDPDGFVSGALFSVDGRSTLPGSENDMSMNQCLEGFEEEPVLWGRVSSTLRLFGRFWCAHFEGCFEGFQPWCGRTCCSGTVQRAEIALPDAVPAGSGVLAPSLVGTGRRALRARRCVQVSSSDRGT